MDDLDVTIGVHFQKTDSKDHIKDPNEPRTSDFTISHSNNSNNVREQADDNGSYVSRKSSGRARSIPTAFRARKNTIDELWNGDDSSDHDKKLVRKGSNGREGGTTVHLKIYESKSLVNMGGIGRGENNEMGDSSREVTRHILYKEAVYTCAHMLGKPSKRFPCSKEDITVYSHQTFSSDWNEQRAVNEHVESEPFPFTIVNTKVRRAEGLRGKGSYTQVDPYCVVALETEESLHRKDWQTINIGSPLKPKKFKHKKNSMRPVAENRFDQAYENIPKFIKTSIQIQTVNPVWEQRFQCLALRPGVDILTVEVWDHDDEESVLKAIKAFKDTNNTSDVNDSLAGSKKKTRRRNDDFLGKVTIRVADIRIEGEENWYYLTGKAHTKDKEAHGKIRLQLWLVHAYRHGRHYEEVVEPKVMLEKLWDWVLKIEKLKYEGDGEWDGTIPSAATCLLFQYALQNGISEDSQCCLLRRRVIVGFAAFLLMPHRFMEQWQDIVLHQAMIRWNVYAKHKLDLHGVEHRLTELQGVLDRSSHRMGEKRKSISEKQDSHAEIEASMVHLVLTQICPVIRNHLNESEDQVHEAVKSFKQCREILSTFDNSIGLQKIIWLIEAALRMSILEWYQKTFTEIVQTFDGIKRHVLVTYVAKVINEVNAVLKQGFGKWSPLFWLDAMTEYMPIIYDEFQKMIIHDVEAICWQILEHYHDNQKLRHILIKNSEDENLLSKSLFDLYVQTQVFVQWQLTAFKDETPDYTHLNEYHRWFRPILVLWLGFALIRGSEMISKSICIDQVVREDTYAITSSSAVDTATVFHQLVTFWERLAWPDVPEGYVIIHFLTEVMCYYTVLYARLKHTKLDAEGYFDTIDRFDISERLCTALNNIEYVKEHLTKIPDEKMNSILNELEEVCGVTKETVAYRKRMEDTVSVTLTNVEIRFKAILNGVGNRVRPEIYSRIQESFALLANAKNNNLASAMDPLIYYLEDNIVILQRSLLNLNFIRMLQLLWNIVCEEISHVATTLAIIDTNEQVTFFTRVLQIFPCIESYFEGGGAGLNEHDIRSEEYENTFLFIRYMTMTTSSLIALYYGKRGEEQIETRIHNKYGTLKVRVAYWLGKISVEIISASNLIAADDPRIFNFCRSSVPTSDPRVEVELKPQSTFPDVNPEVKKYKTEIKWKTVNPVFEDKCSWEVTATDCVKLNSVILFTVCDYDVLSKNEFLGEAVLPLSVIPGISSKPIPQPLNLILRSVEQMNCNPYLQVLKSRTWDSDAQNFYGNQHHRVVKL